jgi:hypothetical protein
MKEPKRIPLNDNIKNKEPQRIPLTTSDYYDIDMSDDIWTQHENNQQNNTTSIQQLESDETH